MRMQAPYAPAPRLFALFVGVVLPLAGFSPLVFAIKFGWPEDLWGWAGFSVFQFFGLLVSCVTFWSGWISPEAWWRRDRQNSWYR